MSLVRLSGVRAAIGARPLWNVPEARLDRASRTALVGPNGVGKSTLMAAIRAACGAGAGAPVGPVVDIRGHIEVARGTVAAYLGQQPPGRGDPLPGALRARWRLPDLPLDALSGGQRTRAALARVIDAQPDLLLCDEPTNHLDDEGLDLLRGALSTFGGALLVVSHDRTFLDAVATEIWELDRPWQAEGASLLRYPGNYSDYRALAGARAERQAHAYADDHRRVEQLKEARERRRRWAAEAYAHAGVRDPYAQKKASKAASRAGAADRRLERAEAAATAKPWERDRVALPVRGAALGGRQAFTLDGLEVGVGRTVARIGRAVVGPRDRVVLVGPNGAGKTTLLRTLQGEIAPLGGVVWRSPALRTAFVRQERDGLPAGAAAVDVLASAGTQRSRARTIAAGLGLRGERAGVAVDALSGGERTAIALALALASDAQLLLLDEPTNHLDLWLREAVEETLRAFPGAVVLASHDRWLWSRGGWRVWRFEGSMPSTVRIDV